MSCLKMRNWLLCNVWNKSEVSENESFMSKNESVVCENELCRSLKCICCVLKRIL